MGDGLRTEVESQLIQDLEHYRPGSLSNEIRIDWSDPCQEGHCTEALGGTLEEMSNVLVREKDGSVIAKGWIDFVHGGDDFPLFVFWLFLDLIDRGGARRVKDDLGIPQHVWERLPPRSKDACAVTDRYDSRWKADPKVVAWKRGRDPHIAFLATGLVAVVSISLFFTLRPRAEGPKLISRTQAIAVATTQAGRSDKLVSSSARLMPRVAGLRGGPYWYVTRVWCGRGQSDTDYVAVDARSARAVKRYISLGLPTPCVSDLRQG